MLYYWTKIFKKFGIGDKPKQNWSMCLPDEDPNKKQFIREPFQHKPRPPERYTLEHGKSLSMTRMPLLQCPKLLVCVSTWAQRRSRTVAVRLSDPKPKGHTALKDFKWMMGSNMELARRVLSQINGMEGYQRSTALRRIMGINKRSEELVIGESKPKRRQQTLTIPF